VAEQTFTIETAAIATGKSRDQIRRAIRAKKLKAATDPTNRAYVITLGALLEAGFQLQGAPPETATELPPFATAKLEARIQVLEAIERELRDRVANLERLNEQLTASLPALVAGAGKRSRWWNR